MPTASSFRINTRLGRLWLYEVTDTRRRGTADCPGDMLWLRLLGECDASGRIVDASLADGSLTPFTTAQVEAMQAVRAAA